MQLTAMAAPHFIVLWKRVHFDDHRSTRIVFFSYIFEGNSEVMAALTAVPGVNLAIQNNAGNTSLHIAAEWGIICSPTISYSSQHICEGKAEVMGLLMKAPGANLAVKNKDGKTAEQLARYSFRRTNIETLTTTTQQTI